MSEPDVTRDQPIAPPPPPSGSSAGPTPEPAGSAPHQPPHGGPVPPPPPHGGPPPHHHRGNDKPWYRETWVIVIGAVAALLIAFGVGTVFGGAVGYVIGVNHGNDRFIEMPMWSDDGMPWSQDGDTGRERGFGGQSDDGSSGGFGSDSRSGSRGGSGNGWGQGFGETPGEQPGLESDVAPDSQAPDAQAPNGPSTGSAPQLPGSDSGAPSPGTSG